MANTPKYKLPPTGKIAYVVQNTHHGWCTYHEADAEGLPLCGSKGLVESVMVEDSSNIMNCGRCRRIRERREKWLAGLKGNCLYCSTNWGREVEATHLAPQRSANGKWEGTYVPVCDCHLDDWYIEPEDQAELPPPVPVKEAA